MVFTTTGATFAPAVELAPGSSAEVVWLDDQRGELARGTNPRISFGSSATRAVTMSTTFADVVTVNLGFSSKDDVGRYSLAEIYDKGPESVSGVANLTLLTNLQRFLASRSGLSGTLDLTGLSRLEHIECFQANVEAADLTGCDSLVRLCLELCNLTSLDLNPVAATLRDLRAAAQQSGGLEFAPLQQPFAQLYHFCVRDQKVTGHPAADQLPSCEEMWNWGCTQIGTLPVPGRATSVLAAWNAYTEADFSGQWTDIDVAGSLDLTDNQLTRIVISGCRALRTIRLGGNALARGQVDRVLAEVAGWGTEGTELLIDGSNAEPSRAGLTAVAELRARGWTVTVSSS
ncbi:MAG: hypothetical protein KDB60_00625 [Propionibacteriaceae bacterium]|nr:hypothetical protein [Propionibacteriaceae bacterium]